MGEDDIVELLWKSGQVVRSNETQPDPPLVGNASPNLFIQEDEMASWLQQPPLRSQGGFYSELLYSHPQSSSSVSLAPPPPSDLPTTTRTENFLNFAKLRDSMWIPVVGETTQVSSRATPSSSATASCLTPAPPVIGRVSPTFVVPGLTRKEKMPVCEIARTSSLEVCKVETEPIQVQPATETDIADDRKRKDRDDDIEETDEARGSTSRKRSRAAEMHNISERRRREKINKKMKALQDLIPCCNKTDKASMLDDAVEYVKSLQLQLHMMSMGSGIMPMTYPPNMPHMAMGMGMNRPPFIPLPGTVFPRQAHMGDLDPSYPAPCYPFPNIQTSGSFGVHLPSQQPYPVSIQPQFLGYMNPYSQFAGLHQMQQPSPSENQTSQLSFTHANSNKQHE